MKKIIAAAFIFAVSFASVFAVPTKYNETKPENWSEMTYVNLPIYKILDSKDGYVVIYGKNRNGTGSTVIPKKWVRSSKDNPSKLKLTKLYRGTLKSFMTVVKKGGEFHHVVLTIPMDKNNPVWGILENGAEIQNVDKEVLEELEM
ncbi:MAG: hypothetical protein ACTTKL_10330 [Treponema sp.]